MNKIICSNAVDALANLEDNSIDLVITSPPYYGQRSYLENNKLEIGAEKHIREYMNSLGSIFSECVRVCKPTGNIVFNMGDKYVNSSLQLIPYRFAIRALDYNDVILVNEITWVKKNPTPRQYKRRLISATEPFFHFVKDKDYYYNRGAFLDYEQPIKFNTSRKKGEKYRDLIFTSDLTDKEKISANANLNRAQQELRQGKIADFRMKIRGVHKKAFGGQSGGRNNQIEKQGYTVIKMYGKKIKRDIIETSVPNSKNIDHPAIFSLQVVTELLYLLSKEGNVVLDPFCGSGQVCLAAKSLNRNYLGIDLNKTYCNMAENRLK